VSQVAHEDDLKRAIAVINTAMKHNMFPLGVMPESDAAKIVEAEKLVTLCQQTAEMVKIIGESKVPTWPAVRDVLFEAEVLVGSNGDGGEQPSPSTQQASPPSPPSPQSSAPTASAPTTSAPVITTPSSSPSPAPSPSSPSAPSVSGPPSPSQYQVGVTYASENAGEWEVLAPAEGGQIEARSVATGQSTKIPAVGFLKEQVGGVTAGQVAGAMPTVEQMDPYPVTTQPPAVVEHIELRVNPALNSMTYLHPGCSTWTMTPLGSPLPDLNTRVKCAGCEMPFPLTVIEANGYESQTKEEPSAASSPSPAPSQPQSPPSSSSVPSSPVTTPAASPSAPSVTSQLSASTSTPGTSSTISGTGAPVDDAEGDDQYAALLDGVDALFTPQHFPVPHDLESPPELMPEDLTLGEVENRRLHSQYNALSARARYLWAIDHLKAKQCGRMAKSYMKPAMRLARKELGKDATVAEVKLLAEEDEYVIKWATRQEMHADRAEAYQEFFQIYAENVKTLSRDLTYAGAEQEGS
jgi:hypothetical protein